MGILTVLLAQGFAAGALEPDPAAGQKAGHLLEPVHDEVHDHIHDHAGEATHIELPEPTMGPVHLDSWLEPLDTEGDALVHYRWAVLDSVDDARLIVRQGDPDAETPMDAQASTPVTGVGTDSIEVSIAEGEERTVRIELTGDQHGKASFSDRTHYLGLDAFGRVTEVPGMEWTVAGDAHIVNSGIPSIDDGDDKPADGPTDAHCFVDFDANIRTGSSTNLPANIRNQPVPYIIAAVYDPEGNLLKRIVAGSDGTARFRDVQQNPCNENLQLKTELRWYHGSSEKIRMSPADSDNYWISTWNHADIDDGETWTFSHGTGLSPQAYMLKQARESYLAMADNGRSNMWMVKIHRTEGSDSPSGCSACALDDDIWFDGRSRDSESNDDTIYHEYGHNVHHWLNPSGRPSNSYGVHRNCAAACHWWDSVHGTAGSALIEGWANLWTAMVTGDETRRFDIENPDNSRGDHPDLNCWGPNRECAFAGALWDTFEVSGRDIDDFLDVLDQNPQNIFDFETIWDDLGKPAGGSLDSYMWALHISANGDSTSQTDAGGSFTGSVFGDSNWNRGTVSYDPHQSTADRSDYYHLNVGSGERVLVSVQPHTNQDLDLYLYDATGTLVDQSELGAGQEEDVSGAANVITAGSWRFEVRQWGSSQGRYTWDITRGDFDDLDPPELVSAPGAVGAGQTAEICWEVPGFGDITHTDIHWGLSSGNLNQRTASQSGEAPAEFCDQITAPLSGTIYYRLHGQGPSDNLYSDLFSMPVREQRVDSVVITSAPAQTLPATDVTVCWRTTGQGPLDHSALHVRQMVGPITVTTQHTSARTENGPGTFCETFEAPEFGVLEIRAHAMAGSYDRESEPVRVRVTPYPGV